MVRNSLEPIRDIYYAHVRCETVEGCTFISNVGPQQPTFSVNTVFLVVTKSTAPLVSHNVVEVLQHYYSRETELVISTLKSITPGGAPNQISQRKIKLLNRCIQVKSSETPSDTTRAVTNHFVAASSKDLSFQASQQLKSNYFNS